MANVGNGNAGQVLTGNGRTSSPNFVNLGVRSGLQNHGVVLSQGNSAFVASTPGNAGQVLTSNGNAFDPTFQDASGGLLPWIDQTSSKNITANTGNTTTSGSLVVLTLPAICPYGSIFRVVGNGPGGWQIAQNSGQQIFFGNLSTTISTGSLASTGDYDSVEILCTTANTGFTVISGPQGNITVN